MGLDWDGILAYGYDLGFEESGEFELPPWVDEDKLDEEGFEEVVEEYLLKNLIGFTEKWEPDKVGYWDRKREAEKALGIQIVRYCSSDYAGFILSTKQYIAYQGESVPINCNDLALEEEWKDKLNKAIEVLQMKPVNDEPSWLLCTYLS